MGFLPWDKLQWFGPWQPFHAIALTSVFFFGVGILRLPCGLSFTPGLVYRCVRARMRRPVLGILLSSVPLLVGLY